MLVLLFASLVVNVMRWPGDATGLNRLPSRPVISKVATLTPLVQLNHRRAIGFRHDDRILAHRRVGLASGQSTSQR